MPFTITTQPFGPMAEDTTPITEYFIRNTETNEGFSVLPEMGGMLHRLFLRKGQELYSVLKSPDSPQALLADESYSSALLFPFPSRVRHGIYTFDGEAYALRMNEFRHENALHGFVYNQPFQVVNQEEGPTHASLTVRYDYAGDQPGYPFPFSLAVLYGLDRPEGSASSVLHVTFSAVNTGSTRCPVAFGWHPYFTLSEEPIDHLRMTLPSSTAITLNDNLLPVGQEPFTNADDISLHERTFDTPFLVDFGDRDYAETRIWSPRFDTTLRIAQDKSFPYLVVFTPPRRDSIAIEPLTANVNSFNTGEGLRILGPGESASGKIWVALS